MSKSTREMPYHSVAISALAALWLTACGGGGGGGEVTAAPAPGSSTVEAPAAGPAAGPAPAPSTSSVRITALTQQAAPNTDYTVAATAAGTVVVTLPPSASLQVNDTVSVTGESANSWRIAQNAGQTVSTTNLSGNTAIGQSWSPTNTPQPWHWLASNAAGDVLVALANLGQINVSTDAGASWTQVGPVRTWISVDMTPSGDKMVALAFGGEMFISNDRGANWTQATHPALAENGSFNREWESVAISDDGMRIAAAVLRDDFAGTAGPIYLSTDGGVTWAASSAPSLEWRGITMSPNGQLLTAVALGIGGRVYNSNDGGVTWVLSGDTVDRDWYRVAASADGQTIAAAEHIGGRLYISRDRGATWTLVTSTPAGDYTTVAMSADGQVIAASVTGERTPGVADGAVYLSTNGGASFAPLTMPGTDDNWRALAMSTDGNMLVAGTGRFTSTPGQLYTSRSNRTMTGTLGSLTGGQGNSVQLQYLGNGQFRVISSAGGAFSIR